MVMCMIQENDVLTTVADIGHLEGATKGGLSFDNIVIDYVQLYRAGVLHYAVIINDEDVGDVILSATAENFSSRLNDLLRTLNTAISTVDGQVRYEQKKVLSLSTSLSKLVLKHPLGPVALPLLLLLKWTIYLALVQREQDGYVDSSTGICEDLEFLREELHKNFLEAGRREPSVVRSVDSVDHALKRLQESFHSLVRVHTALKEEARPKWFG